MNQSTDTEPTREAHVVRTFLDLADAHGILHVVATSEEQARLLELYQIQNDQGPCMEAFASGRPVMDIDLHAAIERWPRIAPYAIGAGYGSVATTADSPDSGSNREEAQGRTTSQNDEGCDGLHSYSSCRYPRPRGSKRTSAHRDGE